MKLVFAAPASFFSLAEASQAAAASFRHLLVKLASAAPASFFSAAWLLQVGAGVGVCATAPVAEKIAAPIPIVTASASGRIVAASSAKVRARS